MAGPRIRRIRMLKKITQIELLGKLSRQHVVLTQVSIAKIEAGQRALFDYEVFAFARALSIPLSDLLS
jgi:transcriptional regulator with XRE-family HTH domain